MRRIEHFCQSGQGQAGAAAEWFSSRYKHNASTVRAMWNFIRGICSLKLGSLQRAQGLSARAPDKLMHGPAGRFNVGVAGSHRSIRQLDKVLRQMLRRAGLSRRAR